MKAKVFAINVTATWMLWVCTIKAVLTFWRTALAGSVRATKLIWTINKCGAPETGRD